MSIQNYSTVTEYSCEGVFRYPNSLLCFDIDLYSQNLWIPNYSHYQHFLFETITELRNKKMNDVQIANWLNDNGYEVFLAAKWKLQARSDRTGFRLDGPLLTFNDKATDKSPEHGYEPSNIIDQGYPVGGINLAGQTPIILVNDGPSMGGFIVPFTVPSASFWKLGQAKPNEHFKFKEITVEKSQEMRSYQTSICSKDSII